MTSTDSPQDEAPPPATLVLAATPAAAETPPQLDALATPGAPAQAGAGAAADAAPGTTVTEAEPQDATGDAGAALAAPDLSPAATGARLAALFPALFVGPDGRGTWKAIKLRIHADIQARAPGEFSKRTLGIFFARYTTTTAYLKALAVPGAQRCDLDGQPAGEIAEEHRSAAAAEVARRQAIVAERRAAARKVLPPRPAAAATEGDAAPAMTPRPPRQDGDRRKAPVRERQARPPRREPPQARDHKRHDSGSAPPRGPRGAPRHEQRPPVHDGPAAAPPLDPAQRERALLLRAFEASPLSKANFCALKRISEAELDALLMQARADRDTR